jgi:serine phosphatase RsbU (regulator of sigma subunit)
VETAERTRLEALHALGLLDTPSEERFDRVVRLAKRIFDVPMVAVNLIDEDRLFTKSAAGFPAGGTTPRGQAFCPTAIETGESLIIPDARLDATFADNPNVTGAPHVRFYAGAPLAAPGGELVGALCLVDERPRELSETDRALLDDLARWVEYELASDADAVQAKEIQSRLLPRKPPELPGYDIAGRCQPALNVGGDYFDWHMLDDTLLQVAVADVMGKGLSAAVITAGIRTALRVTSRFTPLTESVRRTAAGLQDDFSETATFATMFVARLRPQRGHLEYVDAGHGLAIVVSSDGPVRHLASHDLPLGADPSGSWESREDYLDPGETLIVVSDGLLDVYPDPVDAVRAARQLHATSSSADEMADRILAAGAGQPFDDDLTALVVRREPE